MLGHYDSSSDFIVGTLSEAKEQVSHNSSPHSRSAYLGLVFPGITLQTHGLRWSGDFRFAKLDEEDESARRLCVIAFTSISYILTAYLIQTLTLQGEHVWTVSVLPSEEMRC